VRRGSRPFLEDKIEGNVFLRSFEANGKVVFVNACVGRGFQLIDLKPRKEAIFDLQLLKVSTLLNSGDGWPSEGNLLVDGLTYDTIDDSAPQARKCDWSGLHCNLGIAGVSFYHNRSSD